MTAFHQFKGAPCYLPVPDGILDLAGVSRLAQEWSDILLVIDMEQANERGGKISCAKGCGACCHQRIPVTPADALHLTALVQAMPSRKRSARLRRFREVQAAISEAGRSDPGGSVDPGHRYHLKLACPFLDRGCCSIHPSRPAVCREHLALSEAGHCGSWPALQVDLMPVTHRVWEALGKAGAELMGSAPMVMAMEDIFDWVEDNRSLENLNWPAEKVARTLAVHLFSK